MRVLITGITGFAGSHLAEYILRHHDVELFGIYRWRSPMDNLEEIQRQLNLIEPGASDTQVLRGAFKKGKVNLVACDITDPVSVQKVIRAVEPDWIFHLAAQSYVPSSWDAPAQTLYTNVMGQLNILEAVRGNDIDPRIHIAGTSEEYGLVYPEELPIREENPLRPLSPYAVSKVTQEKLALQYFYSFGLKCIVSRGFNHEGPRRGEVFVTSNFAKQIAEIELGLRAPVIYVGDLSSQRDWTDVRDMVRAYWLLLEKCQPGQVYNIGSGIARSAGEMLDILLSYSQVKVRVEQDPARLRPSDVKLLRADCTKFVSATGWQPQIPFEQTMKDLLDYWRRRLRRK